MTLPKATEERIAREADSKYPRSNNRERSVIFSEAQDACCGAYKSGATKEAERTLRAEERAEKLKLALEKVQPFLENAFPMDRGAIGRIFEIKALVRKALADDAQEAGKK